MCKLGSVAVVQNALRAVVELHSESSELPKVKILICKGREDVVIKVISVTVLLSYVIFAVDLTCTDGGLSSQKLH